MANYIEKSAKTVEDAIELALFLKKRSIFLDVFP